MALQKDSHCGMPHSVDSTASSQDVDSTISHAPSDDVDDTIDSSTNTEDCKISERYTANYSIYVANYSLLSHDTCTYICMVQLNLNLKDAYR